MLFMDIWLICLYTLYNASEIYVLTQHLSRSQIKPELLILNFKSMIASY
jgi:sulfur relay (sulfurtransferase) DsrF/TusC family protein